MKILGALFCTLIFVLSGRQDVFAADEIATVSTLDELKALKPIHLDSGWDVRVGLASGGRDAGPWKLLYCWANYIGTEEKVSFSYRDRVPFCEKNVVGAAVGPVFIRCRWNGAEPKLGSGDWKYPAASKKNLYCGLILLAATGDCCIEVLSNKGDVLQFRNVTVEKVQPCYWCVFAETVRVGKGKSYGDLVYDRVLQQSFAAYPIYDFLTPLLPEKPEPNVIEGPTALENRLPGGLPLSPDWQALYCDRKQNKGDEVFPLELSLEKDEFVIKSSSAKLLAWPDWCLLARWWVNGKPIEPARRAEPGPRREASTEFLTQLRRVRFGFPENLGKLKPTDKAALQVLYCPAGYGDLLKNQPQHFGWLAVAVPRDLVRVPLQSNKLEFVITEELLNARKREPAE